MRKITNILFLVMVIAVLPVSSSFASYGGVVLALSGGGTRGFAHVGVLKVLEEENIPIVGIVGTSMGSIIGGVAACGYSVSEVQDIVINLDLRNLLYDRSKPSDSPLGKEDHEEVQSFYRVLLDEKGKVVGPLGGLSGLKLLDKLKEITYPCRDIRYFKDLPIPFAAVATDLVEKKSVVLRSGSLAESMRASMSIPGLFQPWEIDGRLFVDGGLLANIPVTIARKEFPGYPVIAVNITGGGKQREDIRSVADVIDQSINIMTSASENEEIEKADMVIRPDVGNLPILSTGNFQDIFKKGEEQAREQIEELRLLASNSPPAPKTKGIILAVEEAKEEIVPFDFRTHGSREYTYDVILGGYYSSFHSHNWLYGNVLMRNIWEKDDVLVAQSILGKEWGLKFRYLDAGNEKSRRTDIALAFRHRKFEPRNSSDTAWNRFSIYAAERFSKGPFRMGIGITGEYYDYDGGSDSHVGPQAFILYNSLDDSLDPTSGTSLRADVFWRDADTLLAKLKFQNVHSLGNSKIRLILKGGFFAGDMDNPYSRAYLGGQEELYSLAEHPLVGENSAWWRVILRKALLDSWWGSVNAELFYGRGYLLDDSFESLEEPWETGLALFIPGSVLNARVMALYDQEEDWQFGISLGLPLWDGGVYP